MSKLHTSQGNTLIKDKRDPPLRNFTLPSLVMVLLMVYNILLA